MNLQVFDLKPLKQTFRQVLLINTIILIGCILLNKYTNLAMFGNLVKGTNSILIPGILAGLAFLLNRNDSKQLKEIIATTPFETMVSLFEAHYKRRLWTSIISLLITGIFVTLVRGRYMIYLFIFQYVFSLVLYPKGKVIGKMLKNETIIFQ